MTTFNILTMIFAFIGYCVVFTALITFLYVAFKGFQYGIKNKKDIDNAPHKGKRKVKDPLEEIKEYLNSKM